MEILRRWKCIHCSRSNETLIGVDGTGQCTHCTHKTSVQPSRLRGGRIAPASYPTRMGAPGLFARVRSLGEI